MGKSNMSCEWIEETVSQPCSQNEHDISNADECYFTTHPEAGTPPKSFIAVIHRCTALPADYGLGENGEGGGSGPQNGPGGLSGNNPEETITAPIVPVRNKISPCQRLSNLLDPAKANVKPLITGGMYDHINNNPTGEGGVNLKRDANGSYSSDLSSYTSTNMANIKAGGYYYAGIHSHPNNTYPMFSWSDIYVAYKLIINSTSANRPHSALLLVCEDDHGVKQTYAITFENIGMMIEDTMGNIEFLGMTDKQIVKKLDDKLKEAYDKESKKTNPDYESVFLQFNFMTNIGLYKANSSLTGWENLYIETGYPNAPVKSKNCN
jgi:hypothetical protein